jgi:hypothetical protein
MSGPRRLTGGNPQIPKGEGEAPVRAYIDAMPGWTQAVGRRLDALVGQVVPDVAKAVKWNTPLYGRPGQGWFAAFNCTTRYVKVTFFRGTGLDPLPPVASRVPDVRYWHVHEGEPLDEALFGAWIAQASRLPGTTL